jgi:uncharacterized damage-inducible protein DinB
LLGAVFQFMDALFQDLLHELRRHRSLAEQAMSELDDESFFRPPAPQLNSVAIIVKHLAGNLRSRWTDFLTTDGEKTTRNRDNEFEITSADSRERLMASWNQGWGVLLQTVESLSTTDLDKTVTIRGEPHSARQASLRGMTHIAYHVGQILYLVRLLKPDAAWQTIAPGQSRAYRGEYRQIPEQSPS